MSYTWARQQPYADERGARPLEQGFCSPKGAPKKAAVLQQSLQEGLWAGAQECSRMLSAGGLVCAVVPMHTHGRAHSCHFAEVLREKVVAACWCVQVADGRFVVS